MRFFSKLLLLAGVVAVGFSAWIWNFSQSELTIADKPHTFVVKAGSNIRLVARQLVDEHILNEPWSFIVMARLTGRASQLKAGNYLLDRDLTPYRLFEMLSNGDVTQIGVTFIEGWTFRQMRDELNRHEGIKHLGMAMTDSEILQRIGATETHPEGLFFPDTYYFASGMSDIDILKRAYQAMHDKFAQSWSMRAPGLPYTNPYQALIMASIVEKETGKSEERPQIAGVFLNRLKLGMRLQTDPTVIYGLGESYDGNIHKRDLLMDTPYNTYTRAGLPPTPIANPGMGAIEAALHPDQRNGYLYFVGKGDGSHVFSRNLTDHNRAVARYQLGKN